MESSQFYAKIRERNGARAEERAQFVKHRVADVASMSPGEMEGCTHLPQINAVEPNSLVCEKCVTQGDTWVTLRLCMICGNVGCCDNSKNTHARKHSKETGHPIIMSFEPGEDWLWCYPDERSF